MIRLEPASPEWVRSVYLTMWDALSDDGSGDPQDFAPVDAPGVTYLRPALDAPMGVLLLVQVNAATLELHTALLPEYRGTHTKAVFDALCAHLKATRPDITRLRTWVPDWNRAAFIAAKRVGFDHVGTEPRAFRKHGTVHDLHLFGVSL